jgi:hypothetical protein
MGMTITNQMWSGAQPCDYSPVVNTRGRGWTENNPDGSILTPAVNSVVDPGAQGARLPQSWVTFGAVIDGLSFTAFIGEKHLRPEWLNDFGIDGPALAADNDNKTFRVGGPAAGSGLSVIATANAVLGLAPHPMYGPASAGTANGQNESYIFGAWHPGQTLFCRGDASVERVKNFVNPATLGSFLSRNDRVPYQLP